LKDKTSLSAVNYIENETTDNIFSLQIASAAISGLVLWSSAAMQPIGRIFGLAQCDIR